MKKYIIIFLFIFAPFSVYAQVSYTNSTISNCPTGYICTPTSTTTSVEKIFYMSNAYLTDGINDLQTHVSSGDIVAPQMYSVDSSLEATGSVPDQIKEIAKSKGIKIMPLITNGDDFSQSLIHSLLASTTAQDDVISYLVSEAQNEGYIGWQFDFEHMAATDTDLYSTFIEKSAAELHSKGLILSVAAVARVNDDTSTNGYKNWSGVYNYARIAKSADFISIMTYDDPNTMGSTASMPYDQSVLSYLYGKIPPNKLSLGIPFYYYGWDETTPPGEIVRYAGYYSRLRDIRLSLDPQEWFSDYFGVPYLTYQLDDHQYVIWFDNAKSTKLKIDLINSYGLRGFSAWVLGMENPDVWNAINK